MKLALAVTLVLAVDARPAGAISACAGQRGWGPEATTELPPRAHLAFWDDREFHTGLVAKIAGKPVAVKTTKLNAGIYKIVLVEIDSDLTGMLSLAWGKEPPRTYAIKPRVGYAKEAKATTSRYHHKLPHSTVREVFDGLAIAVDVPAILAHVKIRRDEKAAWTELDVPLDDRTIRLGELGCTSNYNPELLEKGVDLDVDLTLPDGSHAHVKDLARVVLPKLAHPTSDNPSDAE